MNDCINLCDLNKSGDNSDELLIRELQKEIYELCKTSTAKFLLYDEKVSELCTYIKDNLSNALRCLLSDMKQSGELDDIIQKIVTTIEIDINRVNAQNGNTFSPEMYGAVGDGLADDTEAFKDMIADIEKHIPNREFTNELPCKDYSGVKINLTGKYLISEPIIFDTTYGLTLENLNLIASNDFEGEGMLILNNITRNFRANGLTLNGSFIAGSCLVIHDYTLTLDIVNAEITQFNKYGIYADGKGHEIKITNGRVNQFEWGDKDKMTETSNGTGIYFAEDRHDNNISNLIVNYCAKAGIELNGGTTKIVNSHFYSCEIVNKGRYNQFNNCYFDNAPFKSTGFFTLVNSLLLKSGTDTTPFIYLICDSDNNNWIFDTSNISGNSFKAETYTANAIDLDGMSYIPHFTSVGNNFYYVTPFTAHSRLGHTKNPWDEERESYGDETSGYKIYGNLAIIWGYVTENSFCYYPNGLELKETLHISFERQDNKNPNLIPWANTIKSNRFWANSVGTGSTVKWVAIGIVK